MKVRAKEYGQYKGRVYETGQTFDIKDHEKAPWMEEVKDPAPPKKGLFS